MNQLTQEEIEKLFQNLFIDIERIINIYNKLFSNEHVIHCISVQLVTALMELEHTPEHVKQLFLHAIESGIKIYTITKTKHKFEKI